jgi:signal transduction histidine kinase
MIPHLESIFVSNRSAVRPKRPQRTSRSRASAAVPEWERFEALLDGLLAGMARASAHAIDQEIEHWLSQIVLALDIDRTTVWERTFDDRGFVSTLWWGRPGVAEMPSSVVSMVISPGGTARILAGETLVYSRIEDLPKRAKEARAFVEKHGPKANVTLPLQVGSTIVGALSFGKFRGPREWSPELLRRLRVVAQVFAAALERKRVEGQITNLQHQVTTASRRSTLGELAASIAHELNQPLGAIVGNASAVRRLISTKKFNSKQVIEALTDIIDDGKRANDVIRRIKALFRGDDPEKTLLEPAELLAEVVSLLHSQALMRKISLRTELEPSVPLILGDRIQLQQCVMNLVVNAFEAAATDRNESSEVVIRCFSDQHGWLSVSVRDSGPGIDPSLQGKLFDPFVTTKPNGMGMGLLVTRSIIESHGGRVWGSSNQDVGSTFTFTIPTIRKES